MYKLLVKYTLDNSKDLHESVFFSDSVEGCKAVLQEFPNYYYWCIIELKENGVIRSSTGNRRVFTNVQVFDNNKNRVINNDLDTSTVYDYLKETINPMEVHEIRIRFWKNFTGK